MKKRPANRDGMNEIRNTLAAQEQYFKSGRTKDLNFRLEVWEAAGWVLTTVKPVLTIFHTKKVFYKNRLLLTRLCDIHPTKINFRY